MGAPSSATQIVLGLALKNHAQCPSLNRTDREACQIGAEVIGNARSCHMRLVCSCHVRHTVQTRTAQTTTRELPMSKTLLIQSFSVHTQPNVRFVTEVIGCVLSCLKCCTVATGIVQA